MVVVTTVDAGVEMEVEVEVVEVVAVALAVPVNASKSTLPNGGEDSAAWKEEVAESRSDSLLSRTKCTGVFKSAEEDNEAALKDAAMAPEANVGEAVAAGVTACVAETRGEVREGVKEGVSGGKLWESG